MDTAAALLKLEELFWHAASDRDRYADNLAVDAVHVFPGWGVADRDPVLDAVDQAEPWEAFTINDPRVVPLGSDAAAIVYRTRAKRVGQTP